MTRATPDWLLELRNARGAGIDAIALFRGAEPSVIVEAITDCEIRILPVGATLLQPGQSNDTIYVLLSGQLAAYLMARGARRPGFYSTGRKRRGNVRDRRQASLGICRRCDGIAPALAAGQAVLEPPR
jgi:hypothetical protein